MSGASFGLPDGGVVARRIDFVDRYSLQRPQSPGRPFSPAAVVARRGKQAHCLQRRGRGRLRRTASTGGRTGTHERREREEARERKRERGGEGSRQREREREAGRQRGGPERGGLERAAEEGTGASAGRGYLGGGGGTETARLAWEVAEEGPLPPWSPLSGLETVRQEGARGLPWTTKPWGWGRREAGAAAAMAGSRRVELGLASAEAEAEAEAAFKTHRPHGLGMAMVTAMAMAMATATGARMTGGLLGSAASAGAAGPASRLWAVLCCCRCWTARRRVGQEQKACPRILGRALVEALSRLGHTRQTRTPARQPDAIAAGGENSGAGGTPPSIGAGSTARSAAARALRTAPTPILSRPNLAVARSHWVWSFWWDGRNMSYELEELKGLLAPMLPARPSQPPAPRPPVITPYPYAVLRTPYSVITLPAPTPSSCCPAINVRLLDKRAADGAMACGARVRTSRRPLSTDAGD